MILKVCIQNNLIHLSCRQTDWYVYLTTKETWHLVLYYCSKWNHSLLHNLNYGSLRCIDIFKQIYEHSTCAHNQSRYPSNQNAQKQNIIKILESFARICWKLAWFVPLLAFCRLPNKKCRTPYIQTNRTSIGYHNYEQYCLDCTGNKTDDYKPCKLLFAAYFSS